MGRGDAADRIRVEAAQAELRAEMAAVAQRSQPRGAADAATTFNDGSNHAGGMDDDDDEEGRLEPHPSRSAEDVIAAATARAHVLRYQPTAAWSVVVFLW